MDGITPFSHRAEDYAAARPDYPAAVIDLLGGRCELREGSRVADLGSGTGRFTEMLLRTGAAVYACEPNDAMRAEAEARLGHHENFISLPDRAEDLPFEDSSMDLITCAQSFHWFDREAVAKEFTRVLNGAGWVCLVWNSLAKDKAGFTAALRELLDEAGGDAPGKHARPAEHELRPFFEGPGYSHKVYRHRQEIALADVVKAARSRSYWPDPDSEEGRVLEERLMKSAKAFAVREALFLDYTTDVHLGQMF